MMQHCEMVGRLFDNSGNADNEIGQLLVTLEDALEGVEEKDSELSKPREDFEYSAFLVSFKAIDGNDVCEFDEYVKDENQVMDRATILLNCKGL